MTRNHLLATALFLSLLLQAAPRVKFLDLSWSNPTIPFLEEHLADMEKDSPLDGLTVRITAKPQMIDGKEHTAGSGNSWNKLPWRFELFEEAIRRYQALRFTKFTDNFFYLTTSLMDFDWCNDEDWKNVANNFGVAAKVARKMGLKGLLVDVEEYGKRFWSYGDKVHPADISYDELCKVVFGRGQQWGKAIFTAYPDIILFMPYALTYQRASLFLPFFNGVIDVIPQTALIYDGCENMGYGAKSPLEYGHIQNYLRKRIRTEIRSENRVKARAQILLAPAFYLDAHWPTNKNSIYHQALQPELDTLGQVRFLTRNLLGAMEEAEPYIWLYGEKRCWWKGSKHSKVEGLWEDAPGAEGLTQTLNAIKDLDNYTPVAGSNLAPDPTFTGIDKKWNLWQWEDDRNLPAPGHGIIGNGKARAFKVRQGCFHQTIPIKPNTFYFYRVKGGCIGKNGKAGASLCFLDESRKWLSHSVNLHIKIPKSEKLETCQGYVLSPGNAAFVSIQCGVSGQDDTSEIYFTEVFLSEF